MQQGSRQLLEFFLYAKSSNNILSYTVYRHKTASVIFLKQTRTSYIDIFHVTHLEVHRPQKERGIVTVAYFTASILDDLILKETALLYTHRKDTGIDDQTKESRTSR